MPRIGELRTRVDIVRLMQTRDEQGGITEGAETPVLSAWAEVNPLSVSEGFGNAQLQSRTAYVVTLRGRPDVQAGDLVRYEGTGGMKQVRVQGSRVLEERGVWTELSCEVIGDELRC